MSINYRVTVFEHFGFFVLFHTWHQPDALVDQEGEGKDLRRRNYRWLVQVSEAD